MNLSRKFVAITIATGLAACTNTLIWNAEYSTSNPAIGTSLGVDSNGNSYVGGAVRVDDFSDYQALLLKYSSEGEFLQESRYEFSSFVQQLIPLANGNLIAVFERSGDDFVSEEGKTDDIHLISGDTGETLAQLNDSDGAEIHRLQIEADQNRIYISQYVSGVTVLSAWDLDGNKINSRQFGNREISISTGSPDSLMVYEDQQQLLLLNNNLITERQTMLTYDNSDIQCRFPQLDANDDNSAWLTCSDQVYRINAEGNIASLAELTGLPRTEYRAPDGTVTHIKASIGDLITTIGGDGDLYVAGTRVTIYGYETEMQVGAPAGLYVYHPSALESDVIMYKLDAATGQVAWSDDINTPMFAGDNSLTTYFYYPIALNPTSTGMALTFRGFKGKYTGYSGGYACNNYSDFTLFFNTCPREEILDEYAKTFVYSADSGDRINKIRHDLSYPRAATATGNGALHVLGDNNDDILFNFVEVFTRGSDHQGDWNPRDESSAITLLKQKL